MYLAKSKGGVLGHNIGLDSLRRGTRALLKGDDGLLGHVEITFLGCRHFDC